MPMVGGHSTASIATPKINQVAIDIQPAVERHLSVKLENVKATHYTQQVVAGMVYHIRVLASKQSSKTSSDGDNESADIAFHLRVFQPLPHTGDPLELQFVKETNLTESLNILPPRLKLNP
mmetsp:Transcript_15675/g.18889  ORF Transcript_15675/g.18889 Transcript_15675/m.18889 type:complete len:121 (-) Transcript_15675:55-417(-)